MLKVEVAVMPGSGKIELTGSLGDVMQESAKLAVSYVRSIAREYGIPTDFYKTRDIHIQTLIVYALLACLKGLQEQGCDGSVTEAIAKIEKHLNVKAHGGTRE